MTTPSNSTNIADYGFSLSEPKNSNEIMFQITFSTFGVIGTLTTLANLHYRDSRGCILFRRRFSATEDARDLDTRTSTQVNHTDVELECGRVSASLSVGEHPEILLSARTSTSTNNRSIATAALRPQPLPRVCSPDSLDSNARKESTDFGKERDSAFAHSPSRVSSNTITPDPSYEQPDTTQFCISTASFQK
jgi:hypothetical protein